MVDKAVEAGQAPGWALRAGLALERALAEGRSPYRFRIAARSLTWGDACRADPAPSEVVLVRM
ncbi:hypothetical protein AB0H15_49490, partial [Streptomyces milbemycinicus]